MSHMVKQNTTATANEKSEEKSEDKIGTCLKN